MNRTHVLAVVLGIMSAVIMSGCGQKTGPQGQAGPQGVAGTGCSVSLLPKSTDVPNGGSLITCGNGSNTVVLNGTNGVDGKTGATGADGASTVATVIKFCGADNSYPNTFTEDGVCLNGKIYGVYSANGGFMTELPPGTYSSNGINSSCTFTIGNNCSVTN